MPLLSLKELETMAPVFRGRSGNMLASGLMHLLSVDKVNDLYDSNAHCSGPQFTESVLRDLGINYEIINPQILQQLPDGPFITISNHPYGSIDGIILVDIFGHLRPDFKVIVNEFLSRIKTLSDNFICVTPTKNQKTAPTSTSIHGIKEAVAHVRGGSPLGIFPSGAVSDLSIRDRCIRDREWQKPVLRMIKKLNVPIVPVHFLDRNSNFYYALGLIDWKARLLRLPSEVFNKRDRLTRVVLGEIITPEQQSEFSDIEKFGRFLRKQVYDLK